MLEEHALDARPHDRASFQCGEPALDEYLRKYAVQQSAKGPSSIFVLIDDASPSKISGFYTLSAAHIGTAQLSEAEKKSCRATPHPAFEWAAWRGVLTTVEVESALC